MRAGASARARTVQAWRHFTLAAVGLQGRLHLRHPLLCFSARWLHPEAFGGYLRGEAATRGPLRGDWKETRWGRVDFEPQHDERHAVFQLFGFDRVLAQ